MVTHLSHWGPFLVRPTDDGLDVQPYPGDPDPSPLLGNISESVRHAARVTQPMVRQGWLDRGPGPDTRRGDEPFVAVSWDHAIDLVAAELERVRTQHGNTAIYGGSYGWASAGRVHHAQSQVHRFLNAIGGYTASVNSYSGGAAEVLLPHVFASMDRARSGVTWSHIVEHTELIVAFGGMAAKNSSVAPGGTGRHVVSGSLKAARARGARIVLVSPLADDVNSDLEPEWLPLRPATDTALMLALAHTLVVEGLHDRDFLERCCTGYAEFERYVLGTDDGQAKTPEWAQPICEIPAATIRELARRMAACRTLITVSHSLQRAQFGEQPVWMGLTLAAMLGQIGLDGGGFAYSLASLGHVGVTPPLVRAPAIPQGQNPTGSYIPVARIADMLLNPGAPYAYNGNQRTYPDIRLVYWVGGNPFHHHQDLSRLRQAFSRPDTIVVHEPFWTATAARADVVLPTTLTLERNDIGGSGDCYVFAMPRVVEPLESARDDFAVFAGLAERFGVGATFTQGRTPEDWIRWMYAGLAERLARHGVTAPAFDAFWESGELELPPDPDPGAWLRKFRESPETAPLSTGTGKIEITSPTIASFGYSDCPGHPTWLAPDEWLGAQRATQFPLQLIANQPRGRLHSQLDFGSASQVSKVDGREVVRLNPRDAAARGIRDESLVKLFNARGACLAVAHLSSAIRPGVVQLSTGAWYDPMPIEGEPTEVCVNGNPNAVTRDVGTSRLAQGSTGQLCLIDVALFEAAPPPGRGYAPPLQLADTTRP